MSLQSCYVQRPDSKGVSTKDYNERQEISKPIFVQRNNPVGVGLQIATPLIAGAAMYQYVNPIVKYQDGAETKGFKPANAAIGVIGMLAINKLINYAFGYNTSKPITENDYNIWIKKNALDVDNAYLVNNSYTQLTIIPKNKESQYDIKNLNDVLQYKEFYKNASEDNINKVIAKATPVLEQKDLLRLIELYPDYKEIYAAKKKYIVTSADYNTFWARATKFSEVELDKELLSSDYVADADNLLDFLSKYPNSRYLDKVKVNSYKEAYTFANLQDTTLQFNGLFTISENIFKQYAQNNPQIIENYFDALFDLKTPKSLQDIAFFFTKNNWLTNMASSENKLEKAWNTGYDEFSNGDYLVYLLSTFDTFNWGLKKNDIETFIDEKLTGIAKEQVKIAEYYDKRSTNEDMDRFRKSPSATLMATTDGTIHYLVYGNVINESKFSLPVKILSEARLLVKVEGLISKALQVIGTISTGKILKDPFIPKGSLSNSYNTGYLRPKENKKFAILYKIDGKYERGFDIGFDIFSAQYVEKVELDNHEFKILYDKEPLTSNLINTQNAWLEFIVGDLPKVDMLDALRNKSYTLSQNDRDKENEKNRESWRRAMEKARQQEQANKEFSYIISKNNAKVDFKIHLDENKADIINIYSRDNDKSDCCYKATITKYDEYAKNKRGRIIKEYTNKDRFWSSSQQSTEDNFIKIDQRDFPVIVDLWYEYKGHNVSFSVLIEKGAYIEVKPDKNNLR